MKIGDWIAAIVLGACVLILLVWFVTGWPLEG